MRILCILLPFLGVIFDTIESSSRSSSPPGDTHDPSSYHYEPSSSQAADEPPLRERSKSPNIRRTFSNVLGFRFEDLAFIRLIPYKHPHRIFELRSYVFPPENALTLRRKNHLFNPIPTGEQVVLSTPQGDVCAILDKTTCKHTILRAIFTPADRIPARVKININSGAVERMTEEEIAECPASANEQVVKNYEVSRLSSACTSFPDDNPDPGVHHSGPSSSSSSPNRHRPPNAEPLLRQVSESSPLSKNFPNVLGYKFKDLTSIRLTPHNNPLRIFELRTYAFPPDKQIGLITRKLVLDPMQAGEQIVLSTSNGDVCAVLEKTLSKNTILRPIFTPTFGIRERVKINMRTGVIRGLTTKEMEECPVTSKGSVTKFYRVYCLGTAALSQRG